MAYRLLVSSCPLHPGRAFCSQGSPTRFFRPLVSELLWLDSPFDLGPPSSLPTSIFCANFASAGLPILSVPPIWRGKGRLEVAFILKEVESILKEVESTALGGFTIPWKSMLKLQLP